MRSMRSHHCSLLSCIFSMMSISSLVTPSTFATGLPVDIRFESFLLSVLNVDNALKALYAASIHMDIM